MQLSRVSNANVDPTSNKAYTVLLSPRPSRLPVEVCSRPESSSIPLKELAMSLRWEELARR